MSGPSASCASYFIPGEESPIPAEQEGMLRSKCTHTAFKQLAFRLYKVSQVININARKAACGSYQVPEYILH